MRKGVLRTPRFLEKLFPSITWGDPDLVKGPIYLTFDDGPHPGVTDAVLDCLESKGVKAAFFVLGKRIPNQTELLKRILSSGHQIGYHGMTHDRWWFTSVKKRKYEMDPEQVSGIDTQWLFQDSQLLLRPPFGRFDQFVISEAKKMNAKLVQFRFVVGDWLPDTDYSTLKKRLIQGTRPGDIIVLHDGSRNGHLLPALLDEMIDYWRENGFTIGNLNNLVKTGIK